MYARRASRALSTRRPNDERKERQNVRAKQETATGAERRKPEVSLFHDVRRVRRQRSGVMSRCVA